MPIAFITTPALTMSRTSRRPEAKAIAFGGVETGSTNASEHVSAVGIIKVSGCTPGIESARPATTGRKIGMAGLGVWEELQSCYRQAFALKGTRATCLFQGTPSYKAIVPDDHKRNAFLRWLFERN